MSLVPIPLTEEEVDRYYEGMSNASLWPLYHDVVEKPEYHRNWWDTYVQVNKRFAERTAEIAAENAIVWVHDYQLQLVPAMLRQQRPDLTIGFFLHIPFPPYELFTQLPWRSAIVEGLLGADLVGFQRPSGASNFVQLARRLHDLPARRQVVEYDGRTVAAQAFPISIDVRAFDELARSPEVRARAEEIRKELGNPAKIILGVDRLDYTKGIGVRFAAFEELLEDGAVESPDTVLVQVATPSRERVEHYVHMREQIEQQVGHINGVFGSIAGPAGALLQPVDAPRGAGRALPGRRRHARHPVPRRDEPRRQGVRRRPGRPRRGAGPLGVRRRGRGAQAGVPGQPARHRGRQEPAGAGPAHGPGRGRQADAGHAAAPVQERSRPLGDVVLRRPARAGHRPALRPGSGAALGSAGRNHGGAQG